MDFYDLTTKIFPPCMAAQRNQSDFVKARLSQKVKKILRRANAVCTTKNYITYNTIFEENDSKLMLKCAYERTRQKMSKTRSCCMPSLPLSKPRPQILAAVDLRIAIAGTITQSSFSCRKGRQTLVGERSSDFTSSIFKQEEDPGPVEKRIAQWKKGPWPR